MSCGAESEASSLYGTLISGENFSIPSIDLSDPLLNLPSHLGASSPMYAAERKITVEDVTSGTVGGSGVFDKMMSSIKAHLAEQYEKARITGSEYTRAYIELTTAAMQTAITFLTAREKAYWDAQLAQITAITARVALQTTRVQLAQTIIDANTAKVNFALGKLKLSNESNTYCISQYNLDYILPGQYALTSVQTASAQYNLDQIMPAQKQLVTEQANVQRAQTSDQRIDGAPVVGAVGKQKDLYTQQITSYQRDAELKATKLFTDAWTVQKTVDDGILPPDQFANANLNEVLTIIRQRNELDA